MRKLLDMTIMTRKWEAKFSDWAKDNSGIAAVEFAFIAVPFFFIIFGLLEICLLFIVSTTLENGLLEASREIRTGSFQTAGGTEARFRTALCDELFGLLDCDQRLTIDVRPIDNFNSGGPSPFNPNGGVNNGAFTFNAGNANEIMLVRAFYEWDLITPVISAPLANLGDDAHLVSAGIAFRNEPFS